MQKDALFPHEMHIPLLSVASTEIYQSELVPLTLTQAQNALLQTHIVPSKGLTAKLPWPRQGEEEATAPSASLVKVGWNQSAPFLVPQPLEI